MPHFATDLQFSYLKWRQDFGRQPRCLEDHHRIHANVKPLKRYRNNVVKKTKLHKETQAIPDTILSPMNAIRTEYKDFSLYHFEGGWPKAVNPLEPDQVYRHRKKLEQDEEFQEAMPVMEEEMTELVKYNNTMNFYRKKFKSCKNIFGGKDMVPHARIVYKYPRPTKINCRVARISFAPENAGRMAVAHAPFEFDPSLRFHTGQAFFWEVEIPSRPEAMVRADSIITDVRYHPKDLHSICGALFSGQVATWDNRVSAEPQALSTWEVSHKSVCTSALWINSKSGNEFMSCGLDGQIIWWDERNLSEVLDSTWCDPEKGFCREEKAIGTTVIEYEHTLPTKFLAGSERGQVLVFMKKGKTPSERLLHLYKAHKGPVRAIHRNPMFIKNFLTVGDYQMRMFAEDCRESSIIWTPVSKSKYYDANWIPSRPSSFAACRADGYLEWWDMLRKGRVKQTLEFEVVRKRALTAVCAADGGKFIATGTIRGDIFFVQHTDFMGESVKAEKSLVASFFEREVRREKFIEVRYRENRLRKRDADKKVADSKKIIDDENTKLVAAGFPDITEMGKVEAQRVKIRHYVKNNPSLQDERDFFLSIRDEINEKGINAFEEFKDMEENTEGNEKRPTVADEPDELKLTASALALLSLPYDEEPAKPEEPKTEVPEVAEAPTPPPPAATDDTEEDEDDRSVGSVEGEYEDDEEEEE